MTDTVTVASRAHVAIRIQEPVPEEFRDKPGNAPPLKFAVLNGGNHPDARGGRGITRGVDAAMFRAWLDAEKRAGTPLAGLVEEVDEADADRSDPIEYGFEPALQRMKDSGESGGESTVKHGGPLTSEEMAAHSDTPNDDTPRGDPDLVPTTHSQKPATDITSPPGAPSPRVGTTPLPAGPVPGGPAAPGPGPVVAPGGPGAAPMPAAPAPAVKAP